MKTSESDTREAVLRAALAAFARRGYTGTSVQDILAGTGFSKPTLYYYFGSKAGIFKALVEKAHQESHRRMTEAAGRQETMEKRLVEVLAAVFDFVREEPDLTRLAFATAFAAPEELPGDVKEEQRKRRHIVLFESLIREGIKRGELDSGFSGSELALGIHGAMVIRVMLSLAFDERSADRRAARRIVRLFLKGADRKGET